MRKFTLIAMLLGVVMLAGCTGDDPAGPGGTLANVTNFAISDASAGTSVVLTWTAVASNGPDAIDGYKIYFNEDAATFVDGDLVGTIPDGTTTYTHAASSAGYYGIIAYEGDDTSEDYALINDLPNYCPSYTIWNNHAPEEAHSGFAFGPTVGTTGLAASGPFATQKDMYCYDGDVDEIPWLYAGDYGVWGNGHATDFYEHATGFATPTGGSWDNGAMGVGDVVFAELYDGYWVKIYVTALPHYTGGSANAYGITFAYDWQPINGLELFTTASQP
jgi:hypothetical protein